MKYVSAGLLLLFNFLSVNIIAQKCNCPEYYSFKSQWESSEGQSKPYIEKLQSSTNKICVAKSYEWLAMDYLDVLNYDTSDIYFQKAEDLFKKSGCGDSILLTIYKNWAQLYYTKADFAKAQDYSFKLLKAAEASGNPHEIAVCYTMIAQLFNQTGQAEMGIVYSRLAVPYITKIVNPQKASDLLFKLSKRYLWHYQDTKTQSSLDSSELFSYRQLEIARKINRSSAIAAAFGNLEGIAWEKGDLKKALQFLDSSFKYTDSNNYDNLGTNYYDKADIFIELKRYTEAKQMADSALYYRTLNGSPVYIAELYNLIYAKIGEQTGNYKMAYEYKEKSHLITDSIRSADKAKQVTELEKKYNQAKNEKTIKELAQQKRIYLLLAVAGLFALLGLIFFIRQQSMKNKQKIMEAEQRLNRARMNPHFFFNALSSLQSYALEGNDGKSIATNLSKFSHIMRETLESTYKEYVTIEQEKDFLEEYLTLQQMRFPDKFTSQINIADAIEPQDILIPSMILQPFAENSIEHGFTGINYSGELIISFAKKEKDLQITITDNGKGLLSAPTENPEHISRASQIIKDRIYLLNLKLKTRASFTIENNKNGKGVTVIVNLPYLQKSDI
jgi:tetratricopeptide (TPR) repeat protein/anti-sigma regulatory factor (Ser/Thr protein kinase)